MMALPCISVAADEFQCDCALHCWVGSVHLRLSVSNGEGAAMEELLLMRARCRVDDDLTVGRIKATGCDEENSFDGDDYGDYGTIEAMYVRNYCLGSRVKSHPLH